MMRRKHAVDRFVEHDMVTRQSARQFDHSGADRRVAHIPDDFQLAL